MNILVAIGGLAFLILIHEAGHFFTALAVKMRPRRFYIFFPPAIVKWKRKGIEYGIGAIPLGGYVKIPGMHKPAGSDLEGQFGPAVDEAPWLAAHLEPVTAALDEGRLPEARAGLEDLRVAFERSDLSDPARKAAERGLSDTDDALADDAYWRAPIWKRVTVIAAGPLTNLVFAVVLLAIVFMLGVPSKVDRTIATVDPGTPAAEIVRAGDTIVAIDGQPVEGDQISQKIRASNGDPVTLTVERGGEEITVQARPRLIEGAYRLGFTLGVIYESYGPLEALKLAGQRTWEATSAIGASLGRIVTGEGRKEVASPVGIVQASSETLEAGFREYLGILALISLSLALLNLLPLLPLDGGHIAFSLAEGIRGRAIPRAAYERASMIGIVIVLFLFFIGLTNDVNRIRGG
ncbi:MAG TPA: M50 family metallopeptidase [Gaiellaceae bacterium]|nr:M50 family metallopeptidase [Gaiellaceae bacterium]